jgi:hypothetical protein
LLTASLAAATANAFGQDSVAATAADQNACVQPRQRNPLSFEEYVQLREDTRRDLANQREALLARRAELARWDERAQQTFYNAFGTTDRAARDQVLSCLDRELERNSRTTPRDVQPDAFSQPGDYGSVEPPFDSRTNPIINVGEGYYNAPATGRDSRAGVLSHEMSHNSDVCNTDDLEYQGERVYGVARATRLSRDRASGRTQLQPWRNADNLEYYLEGVFDAGNSTSRQNSPDLVPQQAAANSTPAVTAATSPDGRSTVPQTDAREEMTLIMDDNAAPNLPPVALRSRPGAVAVSNGLTEAQFRVRVSQSMQQIEQAYQRQLQEAQQARQAALAAAANQARPQTGDGTAVFSPRLGMDDSRPQGANLAGTPAASQRRNGVYTANGRVRDIGQGNDVVSLRQRETREPSREGTVYIDENQPRQPVERVNRVYTGNGTSQPIGQGSNVVSLRQRTNASMVAGPASGPASTNANPNAVATRVNRVYSGNGTSQPIGQGSNVVSLRQRTNANMVAGPASSPASANANPNAVATRVNRVYSGNGTSQPIGQGSNVVSVRPSSTSQPGVARRQPGTRTSTAALQLGM